MHVWPTNGDGGDLQNIYVGCTVGGDRCGPTRSLHGVISGYFPRQFMGVGGWL